MEQKTGTEETEVIEEDNDATELFTGILLQLIEKGQMKSSYYGVDFAIEDAEDVDGTRIVIARLNNGKQVKIAISNFG